MLAVPFSFPQTEGEEPLTVEKSKGGSVIVNDIKFEHPVASRTVIFWFPGTNPVAAEVVA